MAVGIIKEFFCRFNIILILMYNGQTGFLHVYADKTSLSSTFASYDVVLGVN
jgi:hypothetical protein